ncbi:putative secreted protein (plasmid) [Candidatus Protochlamydia naegleriophila]|uniref:Putative secreted protein n=1 Tax=Candidatus Protochlamydia naegleriophila TaxID=389348 RepID=A0A0U5K7D0_9BACT|nr:hypothetical protein [Candidatus Protochlamydia naegleriophila]CUI18091.1 putative secreted protein [Candidatus Protochlamydia naegleriophila]
MDTFCNSNKLNSFFFSSLLTVFSISAITPSPAYAFEVNPGNINFAIKIEKLVEKFKKYKDRLDSEKAIETMLELRKEVESYTGKKIDLKSDKKTVSPNIIPFRMISN